jgi:hypothetical protein
MALNAIERTTYLHLLSAFDMLAGPIGVRQSVFEFIAQEEEKMVLDLWFKLLIS